MTQQTLRTRLVLEGLVIVGSILLAFALDAWWTDQELERELRLELLSVQRELERNRDLLEGEIVVLDRIVGGSRALVDAIDSSGDPTVSVPDTIAYLSTGWITTFDPSLGAVDALVASGRLSLIENPKLRLGLAGLRGVVADASEGQLTARRIATDQVLPLVGREVDLSYLERTNAEFHAPVGNASERLRDRPVPGFGMVEMPGSNEFRNVIVHHTAWLASARTELAGLQVRIDELIRMIATESG